MRNDLQTGAKSMSGYEAWGGQLSYKGKMVFSSNSLYKEAIIREFHDTPVRGHSRIFCTLKRLAANFHWVGMKRDVQHYIQQCDVCQCNKHDTMTSVGLLQPLPIPDRVWEDVSMDFIDRLSASNGFSIILVVVDRLSKYGHFIALKHPYSAKGVAETFVKEVVWFHGMPRFIVSDWDPVFTSRFWLEFFRLQGSELRMSSAYHPQMDGQTEVLNCCLETYLRCFASSKQKQWLKWLPWVEYWYNMSYHTATRMTPFEAVYGRPPETIHSYVHEETLVAQVEQSLCSRDEILRLLKESLVTAQ